MNNKPWDAIWINGRIAKMETFNQGLLDKAAIATAQGRIAWIGSMSALPDHPNNLATNVYDIAGKCITPGFIDCHTHLVYAGNRSNEFALRLQGETYSSISQKGGGIFATVQATRIASEAQLLEQSLIRARSLLKSGVTTLEIKSGYGLDLLTELKMLRVIKKIGELLPITVHATFLGAHTVPPEYKNRQEDYVSIVCEEMLPAIVEEKLASAVDVFCENIAFDLVSTEKIFQAAQAHGLKIKCHAEQLSALGGAILAARYHAISVEHLEYLSEEGVKSLSESGTVAVLLPGAFYCLKEKKSPPIELLRKYQVPIALASDCNPGTSPVVSLPLMLNMASVLWGLQPEESLGGVTRVGARALGVQNECGTLTVGKKADFLIWTVSHLVDIVQCIGIIPDQIIINGIKID